MRQECEKFRGRKRDLCEGKGLDGRSNPSQESTDRLRSKHGLDSIIVEESGKRSGRKCRKCS